MNAHLLIDAVVQQTMVFIAQLATAGGVRAPLANVAHQVFLDLTKELQSQGVTKKVIADMFGMALRTYHRQVQALRQSQTDVERTVWEAVMEYVRQHEPVSAGAVHRRFCGDDSEVVSGVLNDLVGSGLLYRSGRGDRALYRAAQEEDVDAAGDGREATLNHLVWLAVYREGPVSLAQLVEHTRLSAEVCAAAVDRLVQDGRIVPEPEGDPARYRSSRFEVPLGEPKGWEAAVLDHFQALVCAVTTKLHGGASSARAADVIGGSTWSLDVWPGHPHEQEALGTLARLRREIEDLRGRIDEHNAHAEHSGPLDRVVVYLGQYVRNP